MTTPSSRRGGAALALALLLVTPVFVAAQTTGAQTPPAGPAAKDAAVTLTPFEVKGDAGDTYDALNTNSITGTNTLLNKTPLDAKVFNRDMMDDLGIIDMTDMLWKYGGLGPAVINAAEDVRGTLEGDRQDPKSMTMRGLQINNPRRDGFLRSDTTLLDSFDVQRVEALGGSNSLLFGSGDAGGVLNIVSKRAYVNRRPTGSIYAMGDSEGSRRYTLDTQFGEKYFGFHFNGVKSEIHNFRPGLVQQARGFQVATVIQPWQRLQIRAEYRDYSRDTIFAQAVIVRAPTSLRLPTGQAVDNQNSRYLVAFPEIKQLLNGYFDLTKVDSAIGPYHRDDYFNKIKSVVAEMNITEGLALQLRYGDDARINDALRASSTTIFAPGATGNNYIDPATGRAGTAWGNNTTMTATPFWTGAHGYRAALAYMKDLKRWGRHNSTVFYQDMESWVNQQPYRFYETDSSGKIIQNLAQITNAESGRTAMPAVWIAPFPETILGGQDWRVDTIHHPNGKYYKYAPQVYAHAVPATAGNPMGLSGAITPATGQSTNTAYTMDDTRETSMGGSIFSEWWRGRIDTMVGLRHEEASGYRNHIGLKRGPISYDSLTTGLVVSTPIPGIRVYANYATNAKINFDTTRDIFNQSLPVGKGVSREIGLKFSAWDNRLSGNLGYYKSEAKNFTATLGAVENDVDPAGINGRNGGNAYLYSKTSDGISASLSVRPLKNWEMRINVSTSDGSERSNVTLPQFYNDQFNTTTVGSESVVAIKNAANGSVTPLTVPSNPRDSSSAQIPLSLAMMKDKSSPYYAVLDPESGQITNADSLGLRTPGVGTNVTGLPITDHQLGFVSPSGGSLIVRRSGEQTAGYAERAYSVINNFRITEGRLRNVSVGLATTYQQNYRAYMYNDAADGNKRKMFYFPDRLLHDFFTSYRFDLSRKVRMSIQANVYNVLDTNRVLYLLNSTNGTLRYAQWFNSPRKLSLSSTLTY